jgi:predicted amidohydrolase
MHIIGGTHVIRQKGRLYNVAHLFYPDGRVAQQSKLHITPIEVKRWGITPGEGLQVFETEKRSIAMFTCSQQVL